MSTRNQPPRKVKSNSRIYKLKFKNGKYISNYSPIKVTDFTQTFRKHHLNNFDDISFPELFERVKNNDLATMKKVRDVRRNHINSIIDEIIFQDNRGVTKYKFFPFSFFT